jgi:hypothetical protein
VSRRFSATPRALPGGGGGAGTPWRPPGPGGGRAASLGPDAPAGLGPKRAAGVRPPPAGTRGPSPEGFQTSPLIDPPPGGARRRATPAQLHPRQAGPGRGKHVRRRRAAPCPGPEETNGAPCGTGADSPVAGVPGVHPHPVPAAGVQGAGPGPSGEPGRHHPRPAVVGGPAAVADQRRPGRPLDRPQERLVPIGGDHRHRGAPPQAGGAGDGVPELGARPRKRYRSAGSDAAASTAVLARTPSPGPALAGPGRVPAGRAGAGTRPAGRKLGAPGLVRGQSRGSRPRQAGGEGAGPVG